MVAENVLIVSASPLAGYESMTEEVAVRAWLSSFGGIIAQAEYHTILADAAFDSLDNMIFTHTQLLTAVGEENMKVGHAMRIARDAAQMIRALGSTDKDLSTLVP